MLGRVLIAAWLRHLTISWYGNDKLSLISSAEAEERQVEEWRGVVTELLSSIPKQSKTC